MSSTNASIQSAAEYPKYACRHCHLAPTQHLDDGKCPFEASVYAYVSWDGRWLDIYDVALIGEGSCADDPF